MSVIDREEFRRIFNEVFAENLSRGLNKSEAAAAALTLAQKRVAEGQGEASPLPPSGEQGAQSQAQHTQQLPPKPPSNKDASSALESSNKESSKDSPSAPKKDQPVLISVPIIKALAAECEAKSVFTPMIRLIGEVFSNVEKLSVCFATSFPTTGENVESNDAMEVESEEESRSNGIDIDVDLEAVGEVFQTITSCQQLSAGVGNSLLHAFESLTYSLLSMAYSCSDRDQLRVFMVLLEHPSLHHEEYSQVSRNLFQAMDRLPQSSRFLLQRCFRFTALKVHSAAGFCSHRLNKYLETFREHSAQRARAGAVQELRNAIRAMSLVYEALYSSCSLSRSDQKDEFVAMDHLSRVGPSLPSDTFYLHEVCEEYMNSPDGRRREYKLWRVDRLEKEKLAGSEAYQCQSIISFPYVLTPATKAAVLELDANVEMRQIVNQEYDQAVASGSRYMIPYLVLRIRRSHIMEDTLNHFVVHSDTDYKKPLKVVFDNEEGIDEGGVRKEYYQIMMKQLLDPSYGMFKYHEESRLLWFNSDSFESELEFELIGILLGVAIYNAIIVDFQMPRAIYKKLMGQTCTLDDLSELEPGLAKGLYQILSHQSLESFQECYGDLNFQITYETFGERRCIDLKPGGGDCAVTFENREEYVALYVSYLLDESVKTQFNAFAKGFRKVCGGAALDLFNAEELELLICGNPVLDTHELEAGTRYEDGYSGSEEVVRNFWEVLHEFSELEKRAFLKFMSGSDRSPIEGLAKMNFVISRNGDDEERLPSAHTCFNHMLLPEYSSKEILREKLLYAIRNAAEGFGLI